MPKIPRREAEMVGGASAPALWPTGTADLEYGGKKAFGEATFKMGSVIRKQAEKLQERRDLIDAMEAATDFRGEERDFLVGEIKRQGRDARNSAKRGVDFYQRRLSKYQDTLETDRAKFLFGKMTLADREAGLNKLAQHESVQERELEKQVAERSFQGHLKNVIFSAGDDDSREKAITLALSDFDTLAVYKGQDTALLKAKAEKELRTAAIKELIAARPAKAWKFLQEEKWQKALAENLPALQNAAETAAKRMVETEVERQLKEEFGTTRTGYDRMFEWLSKPSNYEGIETFDARSAQWLYNKLEAEISHRLMYEENRRKKSENQTLRDVFNMADGGNISGALDTLRANPDVSPQLRWSVSKALAEAEKKTDPSVYTQILEDIHGGKITREADIYMKIGQGISGSDARQLATYWKNQQGKVSGFNYMALAKKMYEDAWRSVGEWEDEMEHYQSDFMRQLSWHVEHDNLVGDQILTKAKEILGTIEPGWWDTIKSPFFDKVKDDVGKWPWEAQAEILDKTKHIPMDIRNEIISRLEAKARLEGQPWFKAVTPANIEYLYHRDYAEPGKARWKTSR